MAEWLATRVIKIIIKMMAIFDMSEIDGWIFLANQRLVIVSRITWQKETKNIRMTTEDKNVELKKYSNISGK